MANEIDVVSTDASGNSLPAESWSMSADGTLLVFGSGINNLSPNGRYDVYLKDVSTGDLTLLSSEISTNPPSDSTSQIAAYDAEELPNISLVGNSVVFTSYTTPNRPNARDGINQVYSKNLTTGALRLVSQTADGLRGDSNCYGSAVSAHGRFVAFGSTADNLLPGVEGGTGDAYVCLKDLQTGNLSVVSANAAGEVANARSLLNSISAGGRFVAFDSSATNLVPGATDSKSQIYVKDMRTGALTLASATADGVAASSGAVHGSLSADGTGIAFSSTASNLNPDGAENSEIYVKNLVTGNLVLASSAADGTPADGIINEDPIISSDGRYVVFTSAATNLVPGVTHNVGEVYVKDLQTGAIALLSQDSSGVQSTLSQSDYVLDLGSAHLFSADDTQTLFLAGGLSSGNSSISNGLVEVTQSAPDLELNPVAGNGFVGPRKATHPVLISGTSTELGQQVSVSLDGASSSLGTATVQDDGTWRFRASLDGITPGDHTVLATVQSQPSYLSFPPATASETFTYQPSEAPGLSSASTDAIGPQNVGFAAGSPAPFVYTDQADMGSSPLPGDGQPGSAPFVSLAAGPNPAAFDGSSGQDWLKPNHA